VDPGQIVVAGHGAGAAIALHVAALDESVAAVACEAGLVSYAALTRSDVLHWPEDVVIPGVLRRYDLPDLARAVTPRPLLLAGTQDEHRQPLADEATSVVYAGEGLQISDAGDGPLREFLTQARP
jgi:hypothetical protein